MTTLAMLYEEGRAGLEKDPEKARAWYHRAGFTESHLRCP
jgi:TPR repeat protein